MSVRRKHSKPRGNRTASASVYFNDQRPATSYCHQRSGTSQLAGTDPSNSDTATCVCEGVVCARIRAGACACVRPFVRVCVRDVFAIYDNNI